jgi:hypothetical protein
MSRRALWKEALCFRLACARRVSESAMCRKDVGTVGRQRPGKHPRSRPAPRRYSGSALDQHVFTSPDRGRQRSQAESILRNKLGFPERLDLFNRDLNASLNIRLVGISGVRPQYLKRGVALAQKK